MRIACYWASLLNDKQNQAAQKSDVQIKLELLLYGLECQAVEPEAGILNPTVLPMKGPRSPGMCMANGLCALSPVWP